MEYAADEWVFDELSGRWMDGDKVADAWSEEIGYMEKDLDVAETGRPPISTKWVDVNKGAVQKQIIRSKLVLVAQGFCVKGESEPERSDLFAAMPPLRGQAHVAPHRRSALSGEAV